MSGPQTFQRITQAAIEEHRQINFYLDQINQSLDVLRGDGPSVEPMRRLAAQIEGLKERLAEHHQAEEVGGLFQALLDIMPDCRVEIGRLTNQHEKHIEILEMAYIHALHGQLSEVDALREDLKTFLVMFREHERNEEQLLRRALDREPRATID